MSIASRIKQLRTQKNYTQKDLASLLSVKPTTVSGWELGRNEPSIDMINKLYSIFSVTTDYLIGHSENPGKSDDGLSENQKLVAYSIDPDISDEERKAIIEMVEAAKKFRRRI